MEINLVTRHLRIPMIVLLAMLLAGVPTAVTAADDEFRLPALEGRGTLEPSDLESGSTIIIFWASWSPRSRDIAERTNDIAEQWGGRATVLTVNFQEEADVAREFLGGELEVDTYLDTDGAFSKQHTMTSLPGLLIYRDGEVVFRGKLPADPSGLIAQALN